MTTQQKDKHRYLPDTYIIHYIVIYNVCISVKQCIVIYLYLMRYALVYNIKKI